MLFEIDVFFLKNILTKTVMRRWIAVLDVAPVNMIRTVFVPQKRE